MRDNKQADRRQKLLEKEGKQERELPQFRDGDGVIAGVCPDLVTGAVGSNMCGASVLELTGTAEGGGRAT